MFKRPEWPLLKIRCLLCRHPNCLACREVLVSVLACCQCRGRFFERLKEAYKHQTNNGNNEGLIYYAFFVLMQTALLVEKSWRPLAVPVVSSLRIALDYSDVLIKRMLRFCSKNVFELRRGPALQPHGCGSPHA